jgi:hypothetical protein
MIHPSRTEPYGRINSSSTFIIGQIRSSGLVMLIPVYIFFSVFPGLIRVFQGDVPSQRIFNINGKEVRVTCSAEPRFFGKYSGTKTGYLLLNADGTGEYRYDHSGPSAAGCKPGPISFNWGFILDENNQIVKFEREYGYSIPIIFMSTGESGFQGCRKNFLVDYLLDRRDGTIEVSSSDDWKKAP